jgi:hypothetical protein
MYYTVPYKTLAKTEAGNDRYKSKVKSPPLAILLHELSGKARKFSIFYLRIYYAQTCLGMPADGFEPPVLFKVL